MQKPVLFNQIAALRGQARLRLLLATCLILGGSLLAHWLGQMPHDVVPLGAMHLGYALVAFALAERIEQQPPFWVMYLTALLDALLLTGWAVLLGEFGIIVVPLYIFSSIGYGMRTGSKRTMQVSQLASIAGLACAPLLAGYWRSHLAVLTSCLVSVVIIPAYVGVLMDKIYQAFRFAESESRAKTDLLARVSHELRTPLGGISNAAELLLAAAATQQERLLAQTILALSEHLLGDINDLLDQSKLSVDALRLDSEPMTLAQQIEVARASVETRAGKKGLRFSAVLDPRISDRVLGDPHWVSRVLINLLGNAVKFTESGSVSLNVSLLLATNEDYLIRFCVTDTGIGIAREHQDRIFDPFVQLPGSAPAHSEGTGLGLAISRQVIEQMGGWLRVTSEPGRGSSFWFDLRMQRVPAQPATAPAAATRAPIAARRLLVVDDNATNVFLLQELLRNDGHDVTTASSGEQALQILAASPRFDLLLLDYNLGSMDGCMLLQAYRFGTANPAPAYFLTADATELTAAKLAQAGALGVLTKPVRSEQLARAIESACGDSAADATATALPEPAAGSGLRAVPVVYIDMEIIERLRSIGTRSTFLKELLERANSDIARSTATILAALAESDFDGLRDGAHALKGVCAETGAMRLMNIALGLMRAEDSYLDEQKARIASDLRDTSQRTRDALAELVADSVPQAAGF
jgi:two-component system sensor histidine kinase RpfC